MSDYELPTDTKLRDMLQAKYGKPNHDVPEDGGEYSKGFVKAIQMAAHYRNRRNRRGYRGTRFQHPGHSNQRGLERRTLLVGVLVRYDAY